MEDVAAQGWHTVTPRIVVDAPALVALLRAVFDATGDFAGKRRRWSRSMRRVLTVPAHVR